MPMSSPNRDDRPRDAAAGMWLAEEVRVAEPDIEYRSTAGWQGRGAQRIDARMLRAGAESASIGESA